MVKRLFFLFAFIILGEAFFSYSGKSNEQGLEIISGSFYKGEYAPYSINKNKWNNCNSMNLCNLNKNLFGYLGGLKYINRIIKKDNYNIDIDNTLIIGSQSTITQNKRITNFKGGDKKKFFMISIVPTFRSKILNRQSRISYGVGVGINLALNKVPSEYPNKTPINSQVNLELAYEISKKTNTEIILGLNHRCTLFGLIGGKARGRQWYTISLRKWI